jgi:hypothetical protein
MKALAMILIAAVLPVASASAQILMNVQGPQQTSASGVDPIIRVTTSFRTTVVTDPQFVPDAVKAQETARRALYGMADSECATLSEIFKAECRLLSLQINILGNPANAPPSNFMTAIAVYELKPKGSASGR